MALLKSLATLAALCLVGYLFATFAVPLAYKWAYPTYNVRYRLTVNAQIDGQPKSASSVVDMHVKLQPRLLDNPPWVFDLNGEYPAMDIGDGQTLVALMARRDHKGPDATSIVFRAFGIPYQADRASNLGDLHGELQLAPRDWPDFVVVRDANSPPSINSLDQSAGLKIRIKSVTLAITSDLVTCGLSLRFPWVGVRGDLTLDRALAKQELRMSNFTTSCH
jgi:hypothetical protein